VLEPARNIGFGAACNLAFSGYDSEYFAVINDDAVPEREWLGELVAALDANPEAGSVASQVLLTGLDGILDSAGMLIAADGTSRQRGHTQPARNFSEDGPVLLASGSAAMYRGSMLKEVGGFDDSYFLYCEDTDLGLRALWAGWSCLYAAKARVHHRYSHSAGKASELKAFYVERNRLCTIVKNFSLRMLMRALPAAFLRYWHQLRALRAGIGSAGRFRSEGNSGWKLPWILVKAHCSALAAAPQLIRKRRQILHGAAITSQSFRRTVSRYGIGIREVAEL
jgi:GT2 family glycosyltransferase